MPYSSTPIAKAANKRDKSKFCDFYDTHSQTTTQCCDLKNKVEDLKTNRYLDEFIDGVHPTANSQYGTKEDGGKARCEQSVVKNIA